MARKLVENVTLVRKTKFAYQIPELQTVDSEKNYSSWHWRGLGGLNACVAKFVGEQSPRLKYESFRPEILSLSRHTDFVWLEWLLSQSSLMFCTGKITDCDFTNSKDPKVAVLVPRGWARGVVNCVRSGIVAFDQNGRAITSNGEVGPVVHHPAIINFRLET